MNQRTRKVKLRNDATPKALIYHYDLEGNLISETREDGRAIREYIWANQTPIVQIKVRRDNKGVLNQQKLLYLHTDHLNTPRIATNPTGIVVWRWESRAFGDYKIEKDPDGDGTNVNVRLRFPGQFKDGESGLYYNWNRYYDPVKGRYVTSDPIGLAGGLNTYVYVLNNPLRYVDPFGLYGTTSCDYYNRRCDETGSTYYCEFAQFVCRRTPPGDWPNCVRLCLQQFDVQYCRDPCKPGDIDPLCIVNAHQVCWQECLRDSGPRISSHPY